MQRPLWFALWCASLVLAIPTRAAEGRDPAYAPVTDDPKLPRVLLIGDSISINYTVAVREALAGVANVHRIPENGGPTTNGLAKLGRWLGKGRWDVIHFNWGLHDLKLAGARLHFVPLDAYERNLRKLVKRLKVTNAKLIWASTTPVPKGKLSPPRKPGDEEAFNRAAKKVMEENGVVINDLHALALTRLAEWQRPDNVHFTPEGSKELAAQVAAKIREALKSR